MSDQVEKTSAADDHAHHHYRSNVIPWYVRLIWIGFWIFAVYYTIAYLFPALREAIFVTQ